MEYRKKILWLDCYGALLAGIVVLAASAWLADWYNLPLSLVIVLGIANIVYGAYSFSLATRRHRPLFLIQVLAVANILWAINCVILFGIWRESVSLFGSIHLLGEGAYVGVLGLLEWRWQNTLADDT